MRYLIPWSVSLCHALPVVPRLMGQLMDPLSSKAETRNSLSTMMNIFGFAIVGGASSFLRTVMLNQAKDSITSRLRKQGFASLMTQRELEWFHSDGETQKADVNGEGKEKTTEVAETTSTVGMTPAAIGIILKDDVDTVAQTVTATLANLIRSTSSCVFGTYHMLCLNPGLMGLSLAVAPVVGTLAWLTRKYLKKIVAIQQNASLQAASFLEERLNHILMVKMSNREQDEVDSYGRIQDEFVELGKRASFANGLSMGTMFTLSTTSLCGILFAGGKAVEAKKMTHGELVSFGSYSFLLALGSAGIVKALGDYMRGMQCAVRLYSLSHRIDNERESVEEHNDAARLSSLDVQHVQGIVLEDVSFSYKCDPTTLVLQKISLSISRGEVVVVTGKNGAGKSTLASLLVGLYAPKSGKFLVHSKASKSSTTDAIDYSKELERSIQAKLVQLVPQEPALFNTSILENVRYSRPEAPAEDVSKAMEAANCVEFVSNLEGGLQYHAGRNGSRLSGGQRQRIGLARALLADPIVLVLDEPASSLDSEGETAVADAIKACRESNRALLVITHRSKTLELADRVLVLKEGMIVEEGSFSELQERDDGELRKLMPDLI